MLSKSNFTIFYDFIFAFNCFALNSLRQFAIDWRTEMPKRTSKASLFALSSAPSKNQTFFFSFSPPLAISKQYNRFSMCYSMWNQKFSFLFLTRWIKTGSSSVKWICAKCANASLYLHHCTRLWKKSRLKKKTKLYGKHNWESIGYHVLVWLVISIELETLCSLVLSVGCRLDIFVFRIELIKFLIAF